MAGPARILIVDDDASLVAAIQTALGFHCEVLAAYSGSVALQLLAREPVGLVLVDYLLPEVSGLEILRYVKRRYASVPVLVMAAYGSEENCAACLESGGRYYLMKPFDLQTLRTRVECLLAARQHSREARTPVFLGAGPAGLPEGQILIDDRLQRALAYLEGHYDKPITLADVAREAGMSPSHLCRKFRRATGVTLKGFLTRQRVKRAAELLRNPHSSISDIAAEVGYQDEAYFSRVFRKIAGQAPSDFRRSLLASSAGDRLRRGLPSLPEAAEARFPLTPFQESSWRS